MKNDNTILFLIAGVAVWYFWKKNQVPVNKIKAAGMFAKDAIQNSNIVIPDDSYEKQYKNDQARCV
jgi:hypothetical protein